MRELSSGTSGALSELVAATDLIQRGWHVFRALSPSCPCDLLISHGTLMYRIEVRTGVIGKDGETYNYPKHNLIDHEFDVLAIVLKRHQVIYLPDLPMIPN